MKHVWNQDFWEKYPQFQDMQMRYPPMGKKAKRNQRATDKGGGGGKALAETSMRSGKIQEMASGPTSSPKANR